MHGAAGKVDQANDLVEELITRPATVQGIWDQLPSSVRDRLPAQQTPGGGDA